MCEMSYRTLRRRAAAKGFRLTLPRPNLRVDDLCRLYTISNETPEET